MFKELTFYNCSLWGASEESSSKAVNGSQFLMERNLKNRLGFEGMGFDSFGMAVHFDI